MKKLKGLNKFTLTNIKSYGLIIIAYAILFPLQSAGVISNSVSGQLVPICTYVVMAISLTLTVGFLGELSLGHAGFMSVGAFSGVIAVACIKNAVTQPGLQLLTAIVVGGLFAGIAGLLIGIPVLRLRGDYLAIVTLAFGEIIKNIINCVYVGIDANGLHVNTISADALGLQNGQLILNGPQGAVGIDKLSTLTSAVILILFSLFIVLNLVNSKTGRAITAIRDNRIAAESVGIGITRYKLTAFIISAVLAGMAGAMYAMNFSTIAAKKFDFNTSILVLVFVVLGGMNNIPGTIIATTLLYMLPELLRSVRDYRMLVYAIVLIVVMILTNSEKAKQMREVLAYKLRRKKSAEQGDN
mgnify:CR=1 FL=1